MSLRFRQSMKLLPGVRLNFSKETVGLSFGVPGARYTVNSKGRRTVSTGIPGTGLYNVETLSSGTRSSRSRNSSSTEESFEAIESSGPPAPGLFARKAERALNTFLLDIYNSDHADDVASVFEKAAALKAQYPELKYPLDLISFLHGATDEKWATEVELLGTSLWEQRGAAFDDKYVRKYFKGIKPGVSISPGITTRLHYNEQTLGFIWSEILQSQKKYEEAVAVLTLMQPNQMVAISLADIEISAGDFDGAIETTEDIEVFDDATGMLMLLRGVAFRGKDMHEAAIECFKRVLKEKKLPEPLTHRALFERGTTYALMGKKAMGIKDLEKILVDNPDYPEVEKKLTELKK
jgi:tetratricopeptide (TPR) repeat protein